MNSQIVTLQKTSFSDFFDLYDLKNRFSSQATFTPASKGYFPVWTAAGNLLVSLRNISKYANGYKLLFSIGNPTIATFSDVKVKVFWNRAYKKDDNYSDWENNFKNTEVLPDGNLLPGRWNSVEVTIAPATEDETGTLKIELDTSSIYLYTPINTIH